MTELQQTRYDRLMRRVGGLLGPGSMVSEVLSEVFPVVDVERVPGELLFLQGTRIAYGGGQQALVAAEFSKVQIFNPVDSGTLITVTRMVVQTDVTATIHWDIDGIALSNAVGNARVRDSRESTDQFSTGQIRTDTSVGSTTLTGITRILANVPFTLEDENGIAVLAPGTGFQVGHLTVNQSLRTTFYWRERQALDSELNF